MADLGAEGEAEGSAAQPAHGGAIPGSGGRRAVVAAVIPTRGCYKGVREGRGAVGTEGPAMADLYGGEVILRVRAELVPRRRELRLYALPPSSSDCCPGVGRPSGGRLPSMPERRDGQTTPAVVGLLVNIDVDDLDRAVAFYTAAFGLRPGRRFGELGVEMLGAPCAIYLLAKPAGSTPAATAPQRRDYRRHRTPVHLDFVVPDVAAARLEEEIRTHEWGRIAMMAIHSGTGSA